MSVQFNCKHIAKALCYWEYQFIINDMILNLMNYQINGEMI